VRYEELVRAVQRALDRREAVRKWVQNETRRHTRELRDHIDELQTLLQVGRVLASALDPDKVLTAVVDAAVDFTDAEESTLLLLDEATGELYLRASRDFRSQAASTLRLKVDDTLAGQVMRSGKPIVLDTESPEKIKTAYLVHALIYVPLLLHGRVVGVLGVDNREKRGGFSERHVERLSALADYAAVALDNAQLFTAAVRERRNLETVLRHVKEGVLVLDEGGEVVLINKLARLVMDIPTEDHVLGRSFIDFCRNAEVEKGIQEALDGEEYRTEITAPDGRVFSLQAIPIPGVGAAVTFHDVTHFKELDRIKSEFVSAVSHDLRSPLTAILGYVELLERAGPLTPMQQHFLKTLLGL
jgi:K+-sensing histidine kinase KdpD